MRLYPSTCLLFLLPLFLFPSFGQKPQKIRILEKSKLYLEGRSNVNEFTCACEQDFGTLKTSLAIDHENNTVSFPHTTLKIKTAGLDCGHRIMNKDLQKTLQVDQHPYIEVELNRVLLNVNRKELTQYWTHLIAETCMTMVNKRCNIKMPVQARRVGANVYQFRSFQEIRLSDWDIEAPTALLGAIKVADTFVIYFDLFVEVEEDN
ncbi:MAG TPA: YceI family protein [Saprospiraceae bacterium]|nr:YceI family protein [Saprospiraceae bacterium]